MLAIIEIQKLGYQVDLDGERIKLTWQGEGDPDPTDVHPLLAEIKANKNEALQYLEKQAYERDKEWDAEEVSRLTVEEFGESALAARVWSERLKRHIWLVPNKEATQEFGIEGVYFTAEELKHLVRMNPTTKHLETIVYIKEVLEGKLIEFSEKSD